MTEIFQVKLVKVGNSLGFIIPSEIIEKRGFQDGDMIQIEILPSSFEDRNERIRKMAGTYKDTSPFEREKEDRF